MNLKLTLIALTAAASPALAQTKWSDMAVETTFADGDWLMMLDASDLPGAGNQRAAFSTLRDWWFSSDNTISLGDGTAGTVVLTGNGTGTDATLTFGNGSLLINDDTDFNLGTDADWSFQYDTAAGQLLLETTATAALATTDPMYQILVGTTPAANQQVFGIAKGTQGTNTDLFTVDEDGDVTAAGDISVTNATAATLQFSDSDGSPSVAGQFRYDNTVTGLLDGAMTWYDDDAVRYLVDVDTLPVTGGHVVAYNATNDEFEVVAPTETDTWIIAISDETTDLTTGTAKVTFRAPYAATVTGVRLSVSTVATGATLLTVDIKETATTILSTKLTLDASEKTSTTAATAAVISDSAIADDAEITINIDAVGNTTAGKGAKVYITHTH